MMVDSMDFTDLRARHKARHETGDCPRATEYHRESRQTPSPIVVTQADLVVRPLFHLFRRIVSLLRAWYARSQIA